MKTTPYTTYKSSNSRWLGDIPSHWKVKKLKFLAVVQPSNVNKKTVEGEEPVLLCNYTDVYKNEYIDSRLDFMRATATKDEIKKFSVDVGDVIVTKDSETSADIAVPACVAENIEGLLCGYHLTQIKPIDLVGRYLFRLFQSTGFNAQFTVASNGVTRFGLPQYAIANAFSPVPPIDEQEAIARFLNYKTEQIDALIAKKVALLARLADKRTALISHAVTKGLDPLVPMKNSGVDWLGEIPAHWSVCLLKRVADISYGVGGEIDRGLTEGTKLLSLPNITKNGVLLTDEVPLCELLDNEKKDVLLKKGDLLFNWRNGSSDHLGKTAFFDLDGEWTHVSFLLRIRFTLTESDPRYFQYMLAGLRITGFFSSSKAGVNNTFNMFELSNLFVIRPPLEEQRLIAKILDNHSISIDLQVRKITSAIAILKEYRSALITNAVTGKIDVRDINIPAPAEADALSVGR